MNKNFKNYEVFKRNYLFLAYLTYWKDIFYNGLSDENYWDVVSF